MTFGELKSAIRSRIWPEGQQENLVAAHDSFFVQAMVDLQNAVDCYKYGNTDTYPQCSTYYNCGMTVLPAPRGPVNRLYTIGKKKTNGAKDGTVVGSVDVSASLLELVDSELVSNPTVAAVCDIENDGAYTISVIQEISASSLYPANSPQYFRTEIKYTDTNGNLKTIQPTDLIHINTNKKSGSVVVNAKGGTSISCVITPFNIPQIDGDMVASISVVVGDGVSEDSDDWCSKVYYEQVDFCHIANYMNSCNSCNTGNQSVSSAMVANLFGVWRNKRRYPTPTDVGYESLPPLPAGFHYPQSSTDIGGRSPKGVFAIHRGRIYIAPWIETSETVIVEWNGVKNNWADSDIVDDDPKFAEAVQLIVAIQHYTYYEDNAKRLADFKQSFYGIPGTPLIGVQRELIYACHERTRIRQCGEVGNAGSAAVGIGILNGQSGGGGGNLYFNEAQSFTASCPDGQSGSSVTVKIDAGRFSSALSVADANAKAMAQAISDANSRLSCSDGVGYYNTEQTYTARCPAANGDTPAAVGSESTFTVPARTYRSTVSQEFADAAALNAAKIQAQSNLSCTFYNSPQTYTAVCPDGSVGDEITEDVSAGQFTSTVSQSDANEKAKASAQSIAESQLSCSIPTFIVGNDPQQVIVQGVKLIAGCASSFTYNIIIDIPANTYTKSATASTADAAKLFVNQQALTAANIKAQTVYNLQLNAFTASCAFSASTTA